MVNEITQQSAADNKLQVEIINVSTFQELVNAIIDPTTGKIMD